MVSLYLGRKVLKDEFKFKIIPLRATIYFFNVSCKIVLPKVA